MGDLLISNVMAAFAVIVFFVGLCLVFYFAGYSWSLGAERARQKAHRELVDRTIKKMSDVQT